MFEKLNLMSMSDVIEKKSRMITLTFIIGIFAGASFILLVSYIINQNQPEKIIGTWQMVTPLNGSVTMINFGFYGNNTAILSSQYASVSGSYEINDSMLILAFPGSQTMNYMYKFITDNSISLIQVGQNSGTVLTRIS